MKLQYKIITYVLIFGTIIYLLQSRNYYKEIAKTEKENIENYMKFDSLHSMELQLTKKEIKTYLEFERKDLTEKMEKLNIKAKQIERIQTNTIEYRDTTDKEIDLQPILTAIKNSKSLKLPFIDQNECMTVSGFTSFENDTLKTVINNRSYNDTIDVIRSWKRKKILGIGIGKKVFKTDIVNNCGDVSVKYVEKKQK